MQSIKLKKVMNIRDLGGMETADGKRIKRGLLIRSGRLYHLPDSTKQSLSDMGITTVVDLRIPAECKDHPDTFIDGSRYVWIPVLCTPTAGMTHEKSMRLTVKNQSYRIKHEFGTADNYMIQVYRSIIFSDESQAALARFLRLVINEPGCILWHCASGKDRAGICAMLVEALLGVDENDIVKDYIASGKNLRKRYFLTKLALALAPISIRFKKVLFGLMRTKRTYLETVIQDIKTQCGSIIEYCKTHLGITNSDILLLKEKYLA